MTLDELKKRSKLRLIVMSMSTTLPIIVILVMAIGQFEIGESKSIFELAPYVPIIVCVLVLMWLVYKIVNYVRILKDDEYANKVLINKNDERNKFIRLKSNALSHKIFIYSLSVITIFSAFIDYQYFYTCLGILIGFLIIQFAVFMYYRNKY